MSQPNQSEHSGAYVSSSGSPATVHAIHASQTGLSPSYNQKYNGHAPGTQPVQAQPNQFIYAADHDNKESKGGVEWGMFFSGLFLSVFFSFLAVIGFFTVKDMKRKKAYIAGWTVGFFIATISAIIFFNVSR